MKMNMNIITDNNNKRDEVHRLREAAYQFWHNYGKSSGDWDTARVQQDDLMKSLRSGDTWVSATGETVPNYKPIDQQLVILKELTSELSTQDIDSLYRQSIVRREYKMVSSGTPADRQDFEVDTQDRTVTRPDYANSDELRLKRMYSTLSGVETQIKQLDNKESALTKNDAKRLNGLRAKQHELRTQIQELSVGDHNLSDNIITSKYKTIIAR